MNPTDWQPVDTIPLGIPVRIKSVKGIECIAKHSETRTRWIKRADRYGPRRVHCWRLDCPRANRGDIWAVAWRPA